MEIIDISKTVSLSSPHLFALRVSEDTDGKNNIMGVSWFFCVAKTSKDDFVS